jgi:hypothetical protein
MKRKLNNPDIPIAIADLYPHLSDEQLQEAEENLSRYIQLALQIYRRIQEDPELYAEFKDLTVSKCHPSMHDTKADHSNKSHSSKQ